MRFNVQNLAECLVQLLDTHSKIYPFTNRKIHSRANFSYFRDSSFFEKKILADKISLLLQKRKKFPSSTRKMGWIRFRLSPCPICYYLRLSKEITDGWCWFFMKKKRREKNFGIFPLYAAAAVFAHLRLLRNIPFLQRVDALHKLLWNFSFTLLMNYSTRKNLHIFFALSWNLNSLYVWTLPHYTATHHHRIATPARCEVISGILQSPFWLHPSSRWCHPTAIHNALLYIEYNPSLLLHLRKYVEC